MGWWFGRKNAPADARPFVPAWLCSDTAEEGFARFLTFEVIADEAPVLVGNVLNDASRERIECTSEAQIIGYAALGRSIRLAVEPLVETFGLPLLDDGDKLRSRIPAAVIPVPEDALGCSADLSSVPRLERGQVPVRELPSKLGLSYYDRERDYQVSLVQADVSEQPCGDTQIELAAVLLATDARGLVEDSLARLWARRDKLVLRLPPRFLDLAPGAVFDVGVAPSLWELQSTAVDGFVTVAELRPLWRTAPAISADAGRSAASADLVSGPLTLALIDIPDPFREPAAAPVVQIAASSPSGAWKAVPLEVVAGGMQIVTRTARRKAHLGMALNALASGQSYLLDLNGTVDVQLLDQEQWLTSCNDEALVDGGNLALLGNELIQFADAQPLGAGRFRLSRLLRGRGGTEWAMALHSSGETFVVIDPAALRQVPVPMWARGSEVVVAQQGASASASIALACESMRPLSPINLRASPGVSGELVVSWARRSRQGFAWIDDIDAPIAENKEQYSVTVAGTAGSIERNCERPQLAFGASELSALGSGPAIVQVRQMGDWATSRPAEISLTLL